VNFACASCGLTGHLPSWLSALSLQRLNLSSNAIQGGASFMYNNRPQLLELDLSNNQLTGMLYASWPQNSPALRFVNMSINGLAGPLPAGAPSPLPYFVTTLCVLPCASHCI
jgi:hypothetical protein